MISINRVDVVMAPLTGTPAADPSPTAEPVERVDVAPDPSLRIIMLARTKAAGEAEAHALGFDPVAIITPRALYSAHGIVADLVWRAADISTEEGDELATHAEASLATARVESEQD